MVRIIADSASDIPQEVAREFGIVIVPLNVYFGDEHYLDGVDLNYKEFYDKLRAFSGIPTTGQVSISQFEKVFRDELEQGNDIVLITLSSKLSGTFQAANIVKDELKADNIYLVDSENVTMGETIIVYEAVRLRDKGLSAAEIKEELEKIKGKSVLHGIISDLTYLKKGGRLSGVGAAVGTVLNVKPIVTMKDGILGVVTKQRGLANATVWSINQIKQGIDMERPIVFGHSDALDMLKEYKVKVLAETGIKEYKTHYLGPTVGSHAGPGCVGIAYFKK